VRVKGSFQPIRARMRKPPKIIKTALWVNCQVAGWCAEAGSSREHRPVDARIVSAHNNGNPYSFAEAVAQEL
jgi:hypothetical protein